MNVVTIRNEEGRELRLATTQNDYVKIFVAYPLEELNEALDGIFLSLRILAPIALLISVIGGWFLAHTSLRPVDAITRTARKISAQNLNQRLPAKAVDDELGRLTATFNDMIERLQESFAQIQRFSADASHELRTPLTIMRGEIEVALRRKRLPHATRELLTSVHDELVRLSSIVESLMILIKSESGRLSFQFGEVALDEMMRELAEDTQVLASKKKIKAELQLDESLNIRGDATRLRQLFLNLLENAVKYHSAARHDYAHTQTRRQQCRGERGRHWHWYPEEGPREGLRSVLSRELGWQRKRSRIGNREMDCGGTSRNNRGGEPREKGKHVHGHASSPPLFRVKHVHRLLQCSSLLPSFLNLTLIFVAFFAIYVASNVDDSTLHRSRRHERFTTCSAHGSRGFSQSTYAEILLLLRRPPWCWNQRGRSR